MALAGFCAFLPLYAPQPLLPMLAAQFQSTVSSISLLLTSTTLGVALAAPLTGILADRAGRRHVIVPAMLLLAVVSMLAARATGLPELLFWRFSCDRKQPLRLAPGRKADPYVTAQQALRRSVPTPNRLQIR